MIDPGMFSKSDVIKKFEWLGPRIPYGEKDIKGDTFPLTGPGRKRGTTGSMSGRSG
jgi:hypothetical protein